MTREVPGRTLSETFDVVLFMGVYYHLKDPIRSSTELRKVLRSNGKILVEGAIIDQPGCFAKFYYRDAFCEDNSDWWVPTIECLKQWVECSFLSIEWLGDQWGYKDNQRCTLVARAVHHRDPLYLRVPEELEAFNR
jgi:tRNA (mo5U34)-methyltransferase